MTRQEVKDRNAAFIAKAIRDAGYIHRTQSVRVKPLEWSDVGHNTMGAKTSMDALYLADSRGSWWWNNKWQGNSITQEEAQSACQADYERRILSALEPVPRARSKEDWVKVFLRVQDGTMSCRAAADLVLSEPVPASPDQWQPIETAPKDGTNIDIWIGRERRTDVRWRMSQDSPNRVWWCELAFDDWKDRWIWSNLAQEFSVSPTHWMPMPSPPTEELGE